MTRRRMRLTGAPLRASVKRDIEEDPAEEAAAAPPALAITFRASAQTHAEAALETLAILMSSAASEHVRVAAANAILDRAHGKPLTGAKAAAESEEDEDDDGPIVVRWLDHGKS